MAKTSKVHAPPAKAKAPAKAAKKTASSSAAPANPVAWFEIYVQDMRRAKRFYAAVFNVAFEKLGGPGPELWAFPRAMDSYGASGALAKMEGFGPGGNSVLVYFSCRDCAIEAKRAVDAGGRIMREKMSIGDYGYIALVFDTEGNRIGLHSMQ